MCGPRLSRPSPPLGNIVLVTPDRMCQATLTDHKSVLVVITKHASTRQHNGKQGPDINICQHQQYHYAAVIGGMPGLLIEMLVALSHCPGRSEIMLPGQEIIILVPHTSS